MANFSGFGHGPVPQPTHFRLLGYMEPWQKFDGVDTNEWANMSPNVGIWIELIQKLRLGPPMLPRWPFFVFGPVMMIREISNIGMDSLDGEIRRCRRAAQNPKTMRDAEEHRLMLIRILKRGQWIARKARAAAKTQGRQPPEDEAEIPEIGETAVNTVDDIEAFTKDERNKDIISAAAVYVHVNKLRMCHSPGTLEFLDDVQRVALGEPWPAETKHAGLLDRLHGYCAVVPNDHPAVHIPATLTALNFFHFERLKMVPSNYDDCSSWAGSPELVRRRNEVIHHLRTSRRGVLVTELLKCRFKIDSWFPAAPKPHASAVIRDSGPMARSIDELIEDEEDIPLYHLSRTSSSSSLGMFVTQGSGIEPSPSPSPVPSVRSSQADQHLLSDVAERSATSQPNKGRRTKKTGKAKKVSAIPDESKKQLWSHERLSSHTSGKDDPDDVALADAESCDTAHGKNYAKNKAKRLAQRQRLKAARDQQRAHAHASAGIEGTTGIDAIIEAYASLEAQEEAEAAATSVPAASEDDTPAIAETSAQSETPWHVDTPAAPETPTESEAPAAEPGTPIDATTDAHVLVVPATPTKEKLPTEAEPPLAVGPEADLAAGEDNSVIAETPTKSRAVADPQPLAATIEGADTTEEADVPAVLEQPAESNNPEASAAVQDDISAPANPTTPIPEPKPELETAEQLAQNAAKEADKAKRKAKEQRRKERRRLEKEAEAEKKRLQDEAKARAREEQHRKEEERKRKQLERQLAEQKRLEEEKRRRQDEEKKRREEKEKRRREEERTRARELAAARDAAEKARREELARQAEETRHAEEVRRAEEARRAEIQRVEEARRAEEARHAEEVRRAEEARRAETRQTEEAQRAEQARHAERAHRAEEARQAEKARQTEEARRIEEARHAEEVRRAEEAQHAEEIRQAEKARLAEEARISEDRRANEARCAQEIHHVEVTGIEGNARLDEAGRRAEETPAVATPSCAAENHHEQHAREVEGIAKVRPDPIVRGEQDRRDNDVVRGEAAHGTQQEETESAMTRDAQDIEQVRLARGTKDNQERAADLRRRQYAYLQQADAAERRRVAAQQAANTAIREARVRPQFNPMERPRTNHAARQASGRLPRYPGGMPPHRMPRPERIQNGPGNLPRPKGPSVTQDCPSPGGSGLFRAAELAYRQLANVSAELQRMVSRWEEAFEQADREFARIETAHTRLRATRTAIRTLGEQAAHAYQAVPDLEPAARQAPHPTTEPATEPSPTIQVAQNFRRARAREAARRHRAAQPIPANEVRSHPAHPPLGPSHNIQPAPDVAYPAHQHNSQPKAPQLWDAEYQGAYYQAAPFPADQLHAAQYQAAQFEVAQYEAAQHQAAQYWFAQQYQAAEYPRPPVDHWYAPHQPFHHQPAEAAEGPIAAEVQHIPGHERVTSAHSDAEPTAEADSAATETKDKYAPEKASEEALTELESLYNRPPRNPAFSRAVSVDRADLIRRRRERATRIRR